MDHRGQIDNGLYRRIGGFPVIDGAFQIADMAEIPVEPDQAGNIIGMIAAPEKTVACRRQVRRALIEREAPVAVADRDSDRVLVMVICQRIAGFSVAIEVVDGFLLALGPKRFAGDVGADRGEGIKADDSERELRENQSGERPNKPPQS